MKSMREFRFKDLSRLSNNKIWKKIYNDYKDYVVMMETEEYRAYALVKYNGLETGDNYGFIYFNIDTIMYPFDNELFDLLHEIGHVMSNKRNMKLYEREYYATVWALNHCKKYGVNINQNIIDQYQNYIYDCRDISIKHKAKNVPGKEELKLMIS